VSFYETIPGSPSLTPTSSRGWEASGRSLCAHPFLWWHIRSNTFASN
jgi:hypothetical protein